MGSENKKQQELVIQINTVIDSTDGAGITTSLAAMPGAKSITPPGENSFMLRIANEGASVLVRQIDMNDQIDQIINLQDDPILGKHFTQIYHVDTSTAARNKSGKLVGQAFIVEEFCRHGSLAAVIEKHNNKTSLLSSPDNSATTQHQHACIQYANGLIQMMLDFKQHNLSMPDIKPSNILLNEFGKPIISDRKSILNLEQIPREKNGDFAIRNVIDSKQYQSPLLFKAGTSKKFISDIELEQENAYKMGLALYELTTGHLVTLEDRNPNTHEHQFNFNHPALAGEKGAVLKSIIEGLTHTDPNKRIKLEDAQTLLAKYQSKEDDKFIKTLNLLVNNENARQFWKGLTRSEKSPDGINKITKILNDPVSNTEQKIAAIKDILEHRLNDPNDDQRRHPVLSKFYHQLQDYLNGNPAVTLTDISNNLTFLIPADKIQESVLDEDHTEAITSESESSQLEADSTSEDESEEADVDLSVFQHIENLEKEDMQITAAKKTIELQLIINDPVKMAEISKDLDKLRKLIDDIDKNAHERKTIGNPPTDKNTIYPSPDAILLSGEYISRLKQLKGIEQTERNNLEKFFTTPKNIAEQFRNDIPAMEKMIERIQKSDIQFKRLAITPQTPDLSTQLQLLTEAARLKSILNDNDKFKKTCSDPASFKKLLADIDKCSQALKGNGYPDIIKESAHYTNRSAYLNEVDKLLKNNEENLKKINDILNNDALYTDNAINIDYLNQLIHNIHENHHALKQMGMSDDRIIKSTDYQDMITLRDKIEISQQSAKTLLTELSSLNHIKKMEKNPKELEALCKRLITSLNECDAHSRDLAKQLKKSPGYKHICNHHKDLLNAVEANQQNMQLEQYAYATLANYQIMKSSLDTLKTLGSQSNMLLNPFLFKEIEDIKGSRKQDLSPIMPELNKVSFILPEVIKKLCDPENLKSVRKELSDNIKSLQAEIDKATAAKTPVGDKKFSDIRKLKSYKVEFECAINNITIIEKFQSLSNLNDQIKLAIALVNNLPEMALPKTLEKEIESLLEKLHKASSEKSDPKLQQQVIAEAIKIGLSVMNDHIKANVLRDPSFEVKNDWLAKFNPDSPAVTPKELHKEKQDRVLSDVKDPDAESSLHLSRT